MSQSVELTPEESREVQMDVLRALDRLCREHELSYFLAFGTLIGALRHEGYIPWDDDIDVYMPRRDYERLHELCRSGALPEHLALASYRDRTSIYPFAKLVDTRTRVKESFVGVEQDLGLWVDIFPLEHVDSEDRRLRATRRRALRLVWARYLAASDPRYATSRKAALVKRLIHPLTRRMDLHGIAARADALARGVNVKEARSGRYVLLVDSDMDLNVLSEEDLLPARRVPFEGELLPVPARAEDVLTRYYGDWRRVPPPQERQAAHLRSVAWVDGEPRGRT